MYVTQHAVARMSDRLGGMSEHLVGSLADIMGEVGVVAYLLPLEGPVVADDGSNGDTLVVIANDGSVETVYFRRSDQDMSAHYFGARRVVDMRPPGGAHWLRTPGGTVHHWQCPPCVGAWQRAIANWHDQRKRNPHREGTKLWQRWDEAHRPSRAIDPRTEAYWSA